MRITLHKQIIHEIWPIFLVSVLVMSFIVVATQLLSIMELIFSRGVNAGYLVRMVLYILPDVLMFAMPAAGLVAVVVGFLRLSSDSEIIGLKSCGISLYQMTPPVLVLSFLGFLISFTVGVVGVPWGNKSFKDLVFQIAQSKADLGIIERVFCEPFEDVVFYVKEFAPKERTMSEVFVVDRRDRTVTNTIVAQKGKIFLHPQEKSITIQFFDGTMFVTEKKLESARTIQFQTYDLNIGLKDIMAILSSRQKAPKEMWVNELREHIKNLAPGETAYNEAMIKLLEKCSIPLAVLLMGLIGVPLGSQLRTKGRTAGVGLSLMVFVIYYLFFMAARTICETGTVSPLIGVWVPDLFLLITSLYLYRRVANERPVGFLQLRFFSPKNWSTR
ncbi:MAG: LPS export ABC transporter permease LptF [Desulfatiglans sp.]|jgi:lipopolysaccharide export system permease protein|nr:LPS export ABC transporter permease LptF [Thermodesulfobacteriota bacterium]MEE4353886.1 LPS export ABC transporter permease LptF [Desulfatiglans sp.]